MTFYISTVFLMVTLPSFPLIRPWHFKWLGFYAFSFTLASHTPCPPMDAVLAATCGRTELGLVMDHHRVIISFGQRGLPGPARSELTALNVMLPRQDLAQASPEAPREPSEICLYMYSRVNLYREGKKEYIPCLSVPIAVVPVVRCTGTPIISIQRNPLRDNRDFAGTGMRSCNVFA
jgi:hypothetical protein